ncbi:MAG: M48 family metalloprotease, partial [Acidobacteriia bacterium]|nr:M48 family metalloprotease [Terriglobia bacterium]
MWTTGTYRRGRRLSRQPVRVEIVAAGLTVICDNAETIYFPFSGMSARRSRDGSLRIQRGQASQQEVLVVGDPIAIEEVNLHAPHLLRGWRKLLLRTAAAVVVLLLLLVPAGYFWLYPLLVTAASRMVPAEVEQKVGQAILDGNTPEKIQCGDRALNNAVQNLADRLARALPPPRVRLRYHIVIADLAMANAYPLPGGSIVLHRGMIVRAATPETLAGVLAHQIQHVESRHATKVIFPELAWEGLLAVATGRLSGRAGKLAASIGIP